MKKSLLLLAALALALPAVARIIYVPDSVSTVQAGITAAANGDTVLLAPGTYTEAVSMGGKLITLASRFVLTGDTAAISATVIDANRAGTVVLCTSGEDTTTCIVGLRLRNGLAGNGGGIYCYGGSPTIRHNIIEDNYSGADGAGIMIQGEAAPVIEHNIIRRNDTGSWGGGIYVFDGSSPLISRNVIYDNGSQQLGRPASTSGPVYVAGRLVKPGQAPGRFAENGGGILVTNYTGLPTKPVIHHNTIYGNAAGGAGGGIYSNVSDPDIRDNIVASNQGYGIFSDGRSLTCSYNDVWNNPTDYGGGASAGTGAISADPVFADSAERDFHILAGSPCIDAGDPGLPKDPDSTRADIGAFWFSQTGIESQERGGIGQCLVAPNPFRTTTAIRFPPTANSPVNVTIHDASGRLVRVLAVNCKPSAVNSVPWDGTDSEGRAVAPGVYFVDAGRAGPARVVKSGN
ncbi:T9SS type A sorting domain-containing protein [candidate division WOR-3 bacterium]|nr:T9SS type A sorting domain-containing protein [candidate division WOR-3 bacterium]